MLQITKLFLTFWSYDLKDPKLPILKVGDQESAALYLGGVGILTTTLHAKETLHNFRVTW